MKRQGFREEVPVSCIHRRGRGFADEVVSDEGDSDSCQEGEKGSCEKAGGDSQNRDDGTRWEGGCGGGGGGEGGRTGCGGGECWWSRCGCRGGVSGGGGGGHGGRGNGGGEGSGGGCVGGRGGGRWGELTGDLVDLFSGESEAHSWRRTHHDG